MNLHSVPQFNEVPFCEYAMPPPSEYSYYQTTDNLYIRHWFSRTFGHSKGIGMVHLLHPLLNYSLEKMPQVATRVRTSCLKEAILARAGVFIALNILLLWVASGGFSWAFIQEWSFWVLVEFSGQYELPSLLLVGTSSHRKYTVSVGALTVVRWRWHSRYQS